MLGLKKRSGAETDIAIVFFTEVSLVLGIPDAERNGGDRRHGETRGNCKNAGGGSQDGNGVGRELSGLADERALEVKLLGGKAS